MEIRIRKADLVKELQLVQGIVERKNSIPILSNVLAEAKGGELKIAATDLDAETYGLDLDGLERAFGSGARTLVLCTPHNPLGRVWTRPELEAVRDLTARYGVRVIAMEVTDARHVDEIRTALERSGNATGVMLQIGTRNAQNFELLKIVGQQHELPVLFKRGMGITLDESLNAAEYLATEGNRKVVFGLRGMKTNMGDPHRNFVDFAHVPIVKRLTRMPVCIDPSHSVGTRAQAPDGLPDIFHVVAQGVVAGANMILVDFHPHPEKALVDGPQALLLSELPYFLEDVAIARDTYLKRTKLGNRMRAASQSNPLR